MRISGNQGKGRIWRVLAALSVIGGISSTHWRAAPVSAARGHAVAGARSCKTVKKQAKKTRVCVTVKPNDVLARQLADAVSNATTDAARQRAIVAVMKALHIGVYKTKTGKALVKGAERGPDDFYLYDYEMISLSGAFERKQVFSLSDLATALTAAGVKPGGKPVDPAAAGGLLHLAIGEAVTHPRDSFALLRLVIRDLGLRHDQPQDLAQDIPTGSVQLDSLQYLLLVSDLLVPIVHGQTQHAAIRLSAETHSVPCRILGILTNLFSPTSYFDELTLHYVLNSYITGEIGNLISTLTGLSKGVEVIGGAGTILDIIHAVVLAYSIKIDSLPPLRLVTHFGPKGHDANAGDEIWFQAQVTMQDDLGNGLIECLGQAGYTIPKKGPVPGVQVAWMNTDLLGESIEDYGTVKYQPADEKTGPDGIETAIFTPKNEKVPGLGTLETKQGGYEPRALWASAFGNMIGTVSQLLTPKLGPEVFWTVSYHQPWGYKFTATTRMWLDETGETSADAADADPHDAYVDLTIKARVCGTDPYKQPWEFTLSGPGYDKSDNLPLDTFEKTPNTWSAQLSESNTFPQFAWYAMSLDLSASTPTATIQVSAFNAFTPDKPTVTAPIQDDKSCPEPSGPPQ